MHTHTHTTVLLLVWNMSGSTRVSRYHKGKTKKVKTNLDLLEQEIVSGSGICWAICKSAPHADNHAIIPPLSFFTGRMPFLTPNQQRQSTEMHNFYARQRSYSTYMLWQFRLSVCPSVCLSVRLSHGWISQKRLKLGSRNFHHTVAPSL